MKTDSLIFDLDGTLWDGVNCYVAGFNRYFEENKIERRFKEADLFDLMGMQEDQYLKIVLPEIEADKQKSEYRKIISYQNEVIRTVGGQLYPDVKEGLEELSKHYKLFIISNCGENTIESFYKWSGLGHLFTDQMAYGDNQKPKHHNINLLVKKYDLKSPVYVGDIASDGAQARISEIPFAFVSYGFGKSELYDLKFNSFKELKDYFI